MWLTQTGRWRAVLRLRAPVLAGRVAAGETHRAFSLGHVLAPIVWYFVVGGGLFQMVHGGSGASSRPASAPVLLRPEAVLADAVLRISTIGVILLTVRMAIGDRWGEWGLRIDRLGRDAAWAVGAYVVSWPVVFAVLALTTLILRAIDPTFQPIEHSTIEFLRQADVPRWAVVLSLINAALLAPIMEELLFRGLLQTALAQHLRSTWVAIAVTAVTFGMIHGDVKQTVLPLIVFGVVLGYVYARSGSLMAAILLHMVFNAKTLLFLELGG